MTKASEVAINHFRVDYGAEIESSLAIVAQHLAGGSAIIARPSLRWTALKLLEGDPQVCERVASLPGGSEIVRCAAEQAVAVQAQCGDDVDMLVADSRYVFINDVVRRTVQRPAVDRVSLTERIDSIVTHRWLGLPIFFAIMYVVFRLVIDVAQPFITWADTLIQGTLAHWIEALLTAVSAPQWMMSLIIDGILVGVGGVIVFVPGLLVLYFFIALLEDSGYMARAAFVMDRFMRLVGLHGKSFIPMVLGFGCAVPAIYATRTIANRRDRILTGMLVPLMSCSARLPVYIVFGAALFAAHASVVIWLLYTLGIVVAIVVGMILTRTLLKPDSASGFLMELPPYRRPSLKGLMIHTTERTGEFLRNAGTLILAVSVGMWVLLSLPLGVQSQHDSYFGRVSQTIAPVFAPLGFGNWQATGALVAGFAAKEVVVSTLGQVYLGGTNETIAETEPVDLRADLAATATGFVHAVGDAGRTLVSIIPGVKLVDSTAPVEDTHLSSALRNAFAPLSALAFMVLVLLYVPCVATLAAIRAEYGIRWAVLAAVYQTAIAWCVALLVFQGGLLLGLG